MIFGRRGGGTSPPPVAPSVVPVAMTPRRAPSARRDPHPRRPPSPRRGPRRGPRAPLRLSPPLSSRAQALRRRGRTATSGPLLNTKCGKESSSADPARGAAPSLQELRGQSKRRPPPRPRPRPAPAARARGARGGPRGAAAPTHTVRATPPGGHSWRAPARGPPHGTPAGPRGGITFLRPPPEKRFFFFCVFFAFFLRLPAPQPKPRRSPRPETEAEPFR